MLWSRRVLALVLGVLGCLLAVVSLLSVWAKAEVLDTDRYVAAVAPLAADPDVQSEVADRVSSALLGALDTSALPEALQPLVAPLVRARTRDVVRSDAFVALWTQTNRTLHEQAVRVLTGDGTGAASLRAGRLTLDLTAVVDAVRREVLDALPGLADTAVAQSLLPSVTVRVRVADADDVDRVRTVARAVDRLAHPLAAATVALWVLAVAVAVRRLRAIMWLGLGLVGAAALTWALVDVGRGVTQDHVPGRVAGAAVVGACYDAITGSLQVAAYGVGGIALGVALLAGAASVVVTRRGDARAR